VELQEEATGQHLFGHAAFRAGKAIHVNEDEDKALMAIDYFCLSIVDPDFEVNPGWNPISDACGLVHVTLEVFNGTLTLGKQQSSGLHFINQAHMMQSHDAVHQTRWEFEASLDAANDALASLIYRGAADFHGTDQVHLTVSDNGGCGRDGGSADGDDSQPLYYESVLILPIQVHPVPDDPYWIVPFDPILCSTSNSSPVLSINANINFNGPFCSIRPAIKLVVPDADDDFSPYWIQVEVSVKKGHASLSPVDYPSSITFLRGDPFRDSFWQLYSHSLADLTVLLQRFSYCMDGTSAAKGADTLQLTVRTTTRDVEKKSDDEPPVFRVDDPTASAKIVVFVTDSTE
jgi:hypothetical protein